MHVPRTGCVLRAWCEGLVSTSRLRASPPRAAASSAGSAPSPLLVTRGSELLRDLSVPLVFLVDKPSQWTSFDVCAKLRGAIGIRRHKVGHAGTLDPLATGLVIVCSGGATRLVDTYQAQEKRYSGTLRLGEETASYDSETPVCERSEWRHLSDADLKAAALHFVGDIEQVPPMYSALQQNGERLYELARRGEVVERPARKLHIASFEVWRETPDSADVHFSTTCSKGTYIRSLAHDLGRLLGTHAHLTRLRRDAIGSHSLDDAWQLPELVQALQTARTRL